MHSDLYQAQQSQLNNLGLSGLGAFGQGVLNQCNYQPATPSHPSYTYYTMFGKKEGMNLKETYVAISLHNNVIIDTDSDYDEIEKRVTKYLEKNIDKVKIYTTITHIESKNKVIVAKNA